MTYFQSGSRKGKASFAAVVSTKFAAFRDSSADQVQARVFWTLVIFLTLVFLLGGGARSDIQSLLFLRPLAVIVCGVALLSIRTEHIRDNRFLFGMAGLIMALAALHLIPLPPAIWQALPGREIVVQIDNAIGIKDAWRPITLTPADGWNAFYSLFVPLAVLLLAVQLDERRLKGLVTPILAFGVLSGVIGILQAASDPHGALYFYRITNNGSAVGLFSNRNHQAILLLSMFPPIAFFASQNMKSEGAIQIRLAMSLGAGILLIPLILITGSRLGLLLGLGAIILALALFQRPEATGVRRRTERKSYTLPVLAFLGFMLFALVVVTASKTEGLKRLVETNVGEEERTLAWRLVSQLTLDHMPIGTGSGSFVQLFQRVEPISSLSPVYFNHAHNDWLEVSMTFGAAGVFLLVLATIAYFLGLRRILALRTAAEVRMRLARMGAAIIILIALASFVDYPLRTPSLSGLFVLACCWMSLGVRDKSITTGNGSRI